MVASLSISTPSLVSNKKPAKTKMEPAASSLEELFSFPSASFQTGTLDPQILLDEWLANDLQQTGFLSESDSKHDVGSPSTDLDASSVFSSPTPDDTSMSTPVTSPLVDNVMTLFPELVNFAVPTGPTSSVILPAVLSANAWAVPTAKIPRVAPVPLAAKPKTLKRAISIDPDVPDDINIKRQRNTDAARRSRLKKVMRMESLEQRVAELESDNARLVLRAAVLESEKAGLVARKKDQDDRVARLETQLAEAHKALTRGPTP